MEKTFAFFGKFILVVAVVGGVAYGAYRLGRQGQQSSTTNPTGELSVTAAPTASYEAAPTAMPEDLQVSPTKKVSKTVTAGLAASSGLSFSKYQITLLDGWAYNNETDAKTPTDLLTISKGQYQMSIYQAPTGGSVCVYAGDPAFDGPSSTYDSFVDITTVDGVHLRRSGNNGKANFTVCDKGPELYGAPTRFGHISYKTPAAPDLVTLTEMDAMVASLKKQ